MKRQSVLAIVALVLTFAGTQAIGYNVSEFPICTNDANQINPAINGSIIVWQDYRNGNWDIYGYDLSTQTEFPICLNSADQINPDISSNTNVNPNVNGSIVVWEDHRRDLLNDVNTGIYGYNLSQRKELRIYGTNYSYQFDPAIDGNFIIWWEYTPGSVLPSHVKLNGYYLPGHTKFLIEEGSYYRKLDISGCKVTWYSDYLESKMYDFCNHVYFSVESQARISGDVVVFSSQDGLNYHIGYIDFSRPRYSQVFGITTYYSHIITYNDPNPCGSSIGFPNCNYVQGWAPNIGGKIIVWENWGGIEGNAIYGFDISTMIWFPICKSNGWNRNPAVDGNIVVWEDKRNGNYDIYGARLEPFCLGKPEMDFNYDCKVDFADLAIMASSWLECNLVPESACWE